MDVKRQTINVSSAEKTADLIDKKIRTLENGIKGYALSTEDIEEIRDILEVNNFDETLITQVLNIVRKNDGKESDAIGVSVAYGAGNLADEVRGILRPTTPGVHVPLSPGAGPQLISEQFHDSPQTRLTLGEAGAIDENDRVFGEAVIRVLSEIKDGVLRVTNHGTAVTVGEYESIEVKPLEGQNTAIYQNLISLPATETDEGSRHGICIVLQGFNITTAHISELFDDENSIGFGGVMCVNGDITATINKGGPDHDVTDMSELQSCVTKVERSFAQELGTITQDPDMVTSKEGHAHFDNLGHFVKASGTVIVVAWPFTRKITATFGEK